MPGIAVLIFTLIAVLVSGEFTFLSGTEALWKIFIRFIRLSATVLPALLILPYACSLVSTFFNRGQRRLEIVGGTGNNVRRVSIMFTRPVQAIAIAMIFATKLISLLQIYSGPAGDPASLLQEGRFSPARFIAATVIGMLVSIILSLSWTMDDLHLRSMNRKTREIRRPGDAVGFMVPVLFGFFGIFSLFSNNPADLALYYSAQIVLVLYPPFLVLAVVHSLHVDKYRDRLLKRLRAFPAAHDCFTDDGQGK